jgi:hypothetical protein
VARIFAPFRSILSSLALFDPLLSKGYKPFNAKGSLSVFGKRAFGALNLRAEPNAFAHSYVIRDSSSRQELYALKNPLSEIFANQTGSSEVFQAVALL